MFGWFMWFHLDGACLGGSFSEPFGDLQGRRRHLESQDGLEPFGHLLLEEDVDFQEGWQLELWSKNDIWDTVVVIVVGEFRYDEFCV